MRFDNHSHAPLRYMGTSGVRSAVDQNGLLKPALSDEAIGGIEVRPQANTALVVEFNPVDDVIRQGRAVARNSPKLVWR